MVIQARENPPKQPPSVDTWTWTSGLPNCEKINFGCSGHPNLHFLLRQLKQTHTPNLGLVLIKLLFCQAKGLEQLLAHSAQMHSFPQDSSGLARKVLHPAPLITSPTAPRLRNALQLLVGASVPLSEETHTLLLLP